MIFLHDLNNLISNNTFLFSIIFTTLGLLIGSFLNVVILRYYASLNYNNSIEIMEWLKENNIEIPNKLINLFPKINLSFPSSHCYSCKNTLKWYHNIPLFSYLFLKGKCGFCSSKISIQYPIVELLTGILFFTVFTCFYNLGIIKLLILLTLFTCLFVSILIDLKYFILPDEITYFLLWSGLSLHLFNVNLFNISVEQSIIGILSGYLICKFVSFIGKLIKGYDVIGDGDLKLLAMLGTFLGIKGVIFTFFAAPFFGIITWIIISIKSKGSMLPYGPSLIFAAIYYLFFNDYIPLVVKEIINLI